jgi:phytoene/squalene synthetase
MFWPKEIWGKYAKKLEDFKVPENSRQAVDCLNELVTDALRHAPHCLQYMAKLRNPDIFRFCAIPQVQHFAPRLTAEKGRASDICNIVSPLDATGRH